MQIVGQGHTKPPKLIYGSVQYFFCHPSVSPPA